MMPFGFIVVVGMIKLNIVIIEARFADLASEPKVFDELVSETSYAKISTFASAISVIRLLFGYTSIDSYGLREVVASRGAVALVAFLLSVPFVIASIGIIASSPVFLHCAGCGFFLELPIAMLSLGAVMGGLMSYILMRVQRSVGWHKVVVEVAIVGGVSSPLLTLGWILVMVDPSQVHYRYEFAWTYIFSLAMFINANAFVGQHVVRTLFSRRSSRNKTLRFEVQRKAKRSIVLSADAALKKEFMAYAKRAMVVESIVFLADVDAFKTLYSSKDDKWRVAKFRNLVGSYIAPGSSLEVNISGRARFALMDLLAGLQEDPSDTSKLLDSFQVAEEEVDGMVRDGPWREFMLKRGRAIQASTGV
jgi:hypothetical protein